MNQDQEHLKLLSIFHYIVGGLAALFSLFSVIYLILGILFLIAPQRMGGNPPPPFLGWIFTILGGGIMLMGWAFAVCVILAGRFIAKRKHYIFCLVISGLNCLFMPFGTVLGVFTIIVLVRPSVKAMFMPSVNLEFAV